MKKILMITAEGYDDSEVLYPYYRMIEEGYDVDISSFETGEVKGKYHFVIKANKIFDIDVAYYCGLIIPGGKAPEKLRLNNKCVSVVRNFFLNNLPICAICHGQQLLVSSNVLKGIKATCYPGIKDDLINSGAIYTNECVVTDKNIVTSRRPEDLPYFMKEFIKLIKNQ